MQKIIVELSIIIEYFRVAPNLCFKTRLSAKPMIWKWFFILMQMKLIITRKDLYLALFWKLELWNTEIASSMKQVIHYLYPWFAGFIPDEFAHLCVIRALRKWKRSLLSPHLTVSILMVPFENNFVRIAPKWESPQIQRLPKFRCCFSWINIVSLPRLKIFRVFLTFSIFFVDFRVTVRRTCSSPQNSSYIYKYFFLTYFIHTFNQFVNQYFTGLRWSVVLFFF